MDNSQVSCPKGLKKDRLGLREIWTWPIRTDAKIANAIHISAGVLLQGTKALCQQIIMDIILASMRRAGANAISQEALGCASLRWQWLDLVERGSFNVSLNWNHHETRRNLDLPVLPCASPTMCLKPIPGKGSCDYLENAKQPYLV